MTAMRRIAVRQLLSQKQSGKPSTTGPTKRSLDSRFLPYAGFFPCQHTIGPHCGAGHPDIELRDFGHESPSIVRLETDPATTKCVLRGTDFLSPLLTPSV